MLKGAYSWEPAFGTAEVRVYLPRDYQMRTTILGMALASSRLASTLRLCSARAEHLSAEGRRDALGGLIGLGGVVLKGGVVQGCAERRLQPVLFVRFVVSSMSQGVA